MLVFNLKKEWYNKIKNGTKTTEYREIKPYWTKRFITAGCKPQQGGGFDCAGLRCQFKLGYTAETLHALIKDIRIVNGLETDLKIDEPVYAINFKLLPTKKNNTK